jgi:hypothetical protein
VAGCHSLRSSSLILRAETSVAMSLLASSGKRPKDTHNSAMSPGRRSGLFTPHKPPSKRQAGGFQEDEQSLCIAIVAENSITNSRTHSNRRQSPARKEETGWFRRQCRQIDAQQEHHLEPVGTIGTSGNAMEEEEMFNRFTGAAAGLPSPASPRA